MFGSIYANHLEVLRDSFSGMSHDYKKVNKQHIPFIMYILQSIYIAVFGIPEIGFQIRGLYFRNIIRKLKNVHNVLDAGSGIGVYSMYIAQRYPKANIVGGEIDEQKILFSQQLQQEYGIKNLTYVKKDIVKDAKEKNTYDFIVNIDVLEHIKAYRKVLENFSHMLKRHGYLYIHTPQPDQKRIFKKFEKWHHDDHVREGFSPQLLKKELERSGFKVVVLRETYGFCGKLAWELNHMLLERSFLLTALLYPFLYVLACCDMIFPVSEGLGTAILAQKYEKK